MRVRDTYYIVTVSKIGARYPSSRDYDIKHLWGVIALLIRQYPKYRYPSHYKVEIKQGYGFELVRKKEYQKLKKQFENKSKKGSL